MHASRKATLMYVLLSSSGRPVGRPTLRARGFPWSDQWTWRRGSCNRPPGFWLAGRRDSHQGTLCPPCSADWMAPEERTGREEDTVMIPWWASRSSASLEEWLPLSAFLLNAKKARLLMLVYYTALFNTQFWLVNYHLQSVIHSSSILIFRNNRQFQCWN